MSGAALTAAFEATLALRLQNPYRPHVRAALRAAVGARLLPPIRAGLPAWKQWWHSLPRVLRVDRAAVLALLVGVSDGFDFETAERRLQAVLDWPRTECTAMAELVCRSLRVCARLDQIVGISPAIRALRADAWSATFGDRLDHTASLGDMLSATPVLILGETGTGKELVAQAICQGAPGRWLPTAGFKPGPTDAINLASLPTDLVFSALFGHRRGAYTGAGSDRAGVLEACHAGAVFLDEVADLPMPAQVALLRSLQEGTVRPLGADVSRPAAPRIISATHRDLDAMVRRDGFRIDLYHRLSSVVLTVPPLRERPEDLPVLAEAVLLAVEPQLRPVILERFDVFYQGVGAGYHWPGNVRELAAVLRTLALGLTPRLMPVVEAADSRWPAGLEQSTWTLSAVKRWYARQVADLHPTRTAAAQVLGVDRSTLRGLLKS